MIFYLFWNIFIVLILLGLIGVIVFLFIKYIIMDRKEGIWNKLFNLYLALISLGAFITVFISWGILINETIEKYMISNSEYLEITNINDWKCQKDEIIDINEREACLEKANKKALTKRTIEYKETVINGGTWLIIALLIFSIHFPIFRRSRKEK